MKPDGNMMKQLNEISSASTKTTTAADNNVMPSMVVRQQRIQMGANQVLGGQSNPSRKQLATANTVGDHHDELACKQTTSSPHPPPPPPLPTCSLIKAAKEMNGVTNHQQQFDQDGLVLPKRVLYHHPVPTAQPIIRDLNRELKFNQIRGKNVLDQKSELKKALEKLEEGKRRREAEQERLSRRTSLELRLEERAERIAKQQVSCEPHHHNHQARKFGPDSLSSSNQTNSHQQSLNQTSSSTTTVTTKQSGPSACKPLSNFSIRSITR